MGVAVSTGRLPESVVRLRSLADGALAAATRFWFVVAALGQALFAYYIAAFYGGAVLRGDPSGWNQGHVRRYVPGDTAGNIAIAVHLLLATIVTAGGPLQLVPKLRALAPAFHRWLG